jgi:hypothetical protein
MQLVKRWNVPRVSGSGLLVISNRAQSMVKENVHPVDGDRMRRIVPRVVHSDVAVIIVYEKMS